MPPSARITWRTSIAVAAVVFCTLVMPLPARSTPYAAIIRTLMWEVGSQLAGILIGELIDRPRALATEARFRQIETQLKLVVERDGASDEMVREMTLVRSQLNVLSVMLRGTATRAQLESIRQQYLADLALLRQDVEDLREDTWQRFAALEAHLQRDSAARAADNRLQNGFFVGVGGGFGRIQRDARGDAPRHRDTAQVIDAYLGFRAARNVSVGLLAQFLRSETSSIRSPSTGSTITLSESLRRRETQLSLVAALHGPSALPLYVFAGPAYLWGSELDPLVEEDGTVARKDAVRVEGLGVLGGGGVALPIRRRLRLDVRLELGLVTLASRREDGSVLADGVRQRSAVATLGLVAHQ